MKAPGPNGAPQGGPDGNQDGNPQIGALVQSLRERMQQRGGGGGSNPYGITPDMSLRERLHHIRGWAPPSQAPEMSHPLQGLAHVAQEGFKGFGRQRAERRFGGQMPQQSEPTPAPQGQIPMVPRHSEPIPMPVGRPGMPMPIVQDRFRARHSGGMPLPQRRPFRG